MLNVFNNIKGSNPFLSKNLKMALLLSIFLLIQNVKFLRIEIRDIQEEKYVRVEIPVQVVEWLIENSEGEIKINDTAIEPEVFDSLLRYGEGKILEVQKENEITKMFVYKKKYKPEKASWIKIKMEDEKEKENVNLKLPICVIKFFSLFIPDEEDLKTFKQFLEAPFKGTIINVESQDSRIYITLE